MLEDDSTSGTIAAAAGPASRWREVLFTFARLGITSFGGPVAHIGYYRNEIVVRRRWLDEAAYAEIVALCQFLPGPASSQVGFSLGVLRAGGLSGGIAAWVGFTLPSAILMVAFAYGSAALGGRIGLGLLHGLKIAAVAIVAQAVWGMARSLAPDRTRASIALLALVLVAVSSSPIIQIGAIAIGAAAGLVLCRAQLEAPKLPLAWPVSRRAAIVPLALFAVILVAPAGLAGHWQALDLFDAFYRSGALVFGGGHVVLPLLQAAVVDPGWVSQQQFLAGYGAAQALPGPLFTFAAYLGAVAQTPPNGIIGASIALIAIFLPGLLLVYGLLPFWQALSRNPLAQGGMRGANAAVVGVLGAALYNPVWTTAIGGPPDFALATVGFVLLVVWRAPSWIVVALAACGGIAIGTVG